MSGYVIIKNSKHKKSYSVLDPQGEVRLKEFFNF